MHKDGFGKGTFYQSLRHYGEFSPPMDKCGSQLFGQRKRSTTLQNSGVHQSGSKADIFQTSQEHFSPKFKKEMNLVHNYQRMMDYRLAKPKGINEVEENNRTSQTRIRVFKNSSPMEQLAHQEVTFGRNAVSPIPKSQIRPMDSFERLAAQWRLPMSDFFWYLGDGVMIVFLLRGFEGNGMGWSFQGITISSALI